MNVILGDSTKFIKHGSDLYKTLLKLEDKTNRIIEEMFKQKIINQSLKSDIKTSGSRPGIIYGLPKIHQRETPLRSILSTVGTHNYNLSK